MVLQKCFGLMLLIALTSFSEQRSIHDSFESVEQGSTDFDYLVFRQIWPQSSCMFPGKNTCTIGNGVNTWVVHGLWPSVKGEMGPSFCDRSYPFDMNKINWLASSLEEYWPNLYTNTEADSFWKHEWEKHGTCALTLPQITDESDYFNVSLSLRTIFDFGKMLKANKIIPDDEKSYDLSSIKSAIQKVLKVEPTVECYESDGVQYLAQMQICLSKQFELVDCYEKSSQENASVPSDQLTECRDSVPVLYPIIKN